MREGCRNTEKDILDNDFICAKNFGCIARNSTSQDALGNKSELKEPKPKIALSAPLQSNTGVVIDSGASRHISNDARSFTSLDDIKLVSIHLSEDKNFLVKRKESFIINHYSRSCDAQTAMTIMLTKVL